MVDSNRGFIVRQEEPFNGGPEPDRLESAFVTPTELFYVRNHGNVPAVDRGSYRLRVGGLVRRPLDLSLDEIRRLPRANVTATLQCAGNRRVELTRVRPIPGELPWHADAISNAVWSGTPLAEVLAAAQPETAARHVGLRGFDETERHGTRFCFGGSIPFDKAIGREVLLADEMNGEPLPPLHGAPLRLVVPGYVGARSVKWLAAIDLQREASDNYFQAKAYRLFPTSVRPGPGGPAADFDWSRGLMLGESSLNSVITSPAEGATLALGTGGELTLGGYAYAGGDRRIERVELSADGGVSWVSAELRPEAERWAWRLWRGRLELSPGEHEIACRAWDSAAQTQPEQAAHLWNFKGYMNNAWHRVRLTVRARASA